jgi:NAD(P)-dependent dehydrogenase (short-subunit alcohol dehydrogenase family)
MLLEDKSAIVTGATSGIGRATVRRFVAEGASVLAVGRNREALSSLAASTAGEPGHVAAFAGDVTDVHEPERIVQAALEAFSGIDVLVNAAGIIGAGSVETTTDEGWDQMLDVNLRAPFRLMRAAATHLAKRRGAIVNVSSVTGLRAFPGVLAYCVSKAGVDQLTRCAALELAPRGVRVNAVNPGVVVTQLHRRSGFTEAQYRDFLEHSKTTHPLGRVGQPEEIAEAILWLASDRSGWITGETLALDGGRQLTCAR